MVASEPSRQPLLVNALHILALFGLAVAQPLFSTLSESPEFFVAHRVGQLEIIAITAVISLGIPLVIICIEALLRWISPRLQHLFHIAVVCTLLLAIAMQMVNRIYIQSVPLLLTLAFALAVGATALYVRSALMQRAITFLSLGAALFPLNFIFVSPVSKIVLGGEAEVEGVNASSASTPVIMIVFDEFNPTALLDEKREIDSVRYPNFAELARTATWFPRATSVHPQTQFAVPAILTGKMPDEANSTPTFNTHPENLFSLLSGHYDFNVVEPLTSLCPRSACQGPDDEVNYRSIVSDLIIVFSYVVTPPSFANEVLPPLNEGWHSFGEVPNSHQSNPEQDLVDSFLSQANSSRVIAFNDFITSIDNNNTTLHFMHILLPHQPYQFFPDGTSYQSIPDMRGDVWPSEINIITTSYHRYITQLGLVDNLLGSLISHLHDKGIFDKSLIILTGDHGRSFNAGVNSRELTSHNIEMLHVPLFVKFPYQKLGTTNQSLVSTLDIIPTVVDALGIETDWNFDGKPLTVDELTTEKTVSIPFRGKRLQLNREEITRLPLLSWQISTFGSGTSVEETNVLTPYHHLIGKDISSIPINNKHGSATAKLSQNVSIFERVDSTSGFLPALFSSEITGLTRDGDSWMAIALNGRIAAITPIFKNANQQDYTRVLLPQRFFVDGSNNFSAFIVDDTDSRISFSPVQTTSRSYMLRADSKSTILISADGTSHEVYNDRVFGYVDDARADDRTLNFNGWAADVGSKLTVDSIIIFDGERSICVATADTPRPDVAEVFDAPEIILSGFNASCSFAGEAPALDAIKLVGISKNGDAGIIQIPAWK